MKSVLLIWICSKSVDQIRSQVQDQADWLRLSVFQVASYSFLLTIEVNAFTKE